MIIPYVLVILGLLLIFLEFFLPGAILGISGAILLLLSVFYFALSAKSLLSLVLFIFLILCLVALLVKFTIRAIKKGTFGKSIFQNTHQEGFVASSFEKEYIGKEGKALSDLKPSGHILIEGKRFQALSKTGYIDKESDVIVTGGQGGYLLVKLKEKEKS